MKNAFSLYIDFVLYLTFFIASLFCVGIMVTYFNKELYDLFAGYGLYLIVFIFFLIIIIFSALLFFYNVSKYSEIKYKKAFGMFLIPIPLVLIVSYINKFFLDSYLITFLLKVLVMIFLLMFIMSIPLVLLSSLLLTGHSPLKRNFIRAQSNLIELMKELQKPIPNKKLDDVYYIAENYHDGIKEIKNSFGELVYFNNIIDSSTKKSLTEILDHLTFSIHTISFLGE